MTKYCFDIESDIYVVYGFNVSDDRFILNCLKKAYPRITNYALEDASMSLGDYSAYAVPCNLNEETGQVIVNEEDKKHINQAYTEYIEFLKNTYTKENNYTKNDLNKEIKKLRLGYFTAKRTDLF